ncbi:SDR family NAD(P)-dependent oxidoreductase [endosymbiont of Lamellibrachia barhami]|uniref:SDR family NAD(P)-dependent oxidoreductase n=1 Tax=endosymbiont of Lamellibrachia barhami TaxID=205975 RepID=UPI0015AF8EE3|nr:SDR family oxidoreductase [endosymbiont of Lamellibrachia barhami]
MTTKDRPVALITGGSRCIGLELAREFARHDHDLVLVARDEHDLKQAATGIEDETGARVTTHALDLTQDAAVDELFKQLAMTRVDVLVNNAGIGDYGPFAESDPERLMAMLQLNMLSLTRLTHHFLQPMVERGSGRVLNVASLVGYFAGGPNWIAYVASKAYVLSFTRGLAAELRGTNVTATALSPGASTTNFVTDARVADTRTYRWLPRVSIRRVASVAYRATMAGHTTMIPGGINKVLAFLGELQPRGIAMAVFAFLSRRTSNPDLQRTNAGVPR